MSFLRIYEMATQGIREGMRRRGANIAVLHVSHPDVPEFISANIEPGALENFNLSVGVTDAFMRKVVAGGKRGEHVCGPSCAVAF